MTKSIVTPLIVLTWLSLVTVNANENPVEFKTDFRYRYDFVDDDSKDSSRRRNRIRSRFGLTGAINEQLKINLRFATAEKNPISANQDLGHDFSLKDPEGLALQFNKGIVFGSIGTFSMDEHESVDAISINGLQIGISSKTSAGAKFKIALARYTFKDIHGRPASEITWNGKIFGNPIDANENYLNDYAVNNISAEIGTKVGSKKIPTVFFIDWVNNSDANSDDKGYQIGLQLAFIDAWKMTYFYKDVERNAVFGALTDSNFGGGGAGHKGHVVNLSYAFSKNFSTEFTWFNNDKKMTIDYTKIFLDLKYKY